MADQDDTTSAESVLPHRFPKKDLTGLRFGRLVVTGFAEYRKPYNAYWRCQCDCGNQKVIYGGSLLQKLTQSCGCFRKEQTCKAIISHGKTNTILYSRWTGMLTRCRNSNEKSYKNYGGRGICVCLEWLHFENFSADMGEPPSGTTLERRDNNGPYSKENCYWGTPIEQSNNKRNNRFLTYNDITQTIAMWAREKGFFPHTIHSRLNQGWSVEDALTIPIGSVQKYAKFVQDNKSRSME